LLSPLLFLPVSIHPEWRVRLCDTFDWYSPKFQWKHTIEEVSGWFEHAGMVDLSTDGFPVSVRGRRPADQRQSLREAKATVSTATY
jgi:glycine cleavage system aminomethyltransferase T